MSEVPLDRGHDSIPTKALSSHLSSIQYERYVEGNGSHRDGVFSVQKQWKNSFKAEGITAGAKT